MVAGRNNLAICCPNEYVVALWHFVAEFLKKCRDGACSVIKKMRIMSNRE